MYSFYNGYLYNSSFFNKNKKNNSIEGPEMVNVVKLVKGETHFGDDEDGDDRSDEEDYGGTENMQKKSGTLHGEF